MKKTLHVAVREFLATVVTKGFLIGIIFMPLVILVSIAGIKYQIDREKRAPRVEGEIAIIDPTGEISAGLSEYLQPEAIAKRRDDFEKLVEEKIDEILGQSSAAEAADEARQEAFEAIREKVPKLTVVELPPGTELEEAKEPLRREDAVSGGGRFALVVVHEDAVIKAPDKESLGNYDLFISENLDSRIVDEIRRGLRNTIVDARVAHAQMDRDRINALIYVPNVTSRTVTEEGEKETHEVLNALLPMGFMLLLFASVMTSSQSLMTTTVEEKSSRVVEVLLSAVSPRQLMAGKILGQMCVGFVMLVVYGGMGFGALVVFALFGMINPWNFLYLVIFYLIAHFVVSSFMAAIGAAVNEMREAQSLMMPVMAIVLIPWILCMPIARNPNSALAVVTSFLPPINSFAMLIRQTSATPPPWWQVWISILIGVVTIYFAVWFAAKVFRVGLLMYGKPPNFKTLIKWVRMA
jgi:ABC-type Na+ efflux pump permease subunit